MRSVLLALGLSLGFAATASAATYDEIKFGTESAYAPFEYKNEKGELVGFDVDVGNAICEKLKAKCTWVELPFDSLIPALNARKFDIIHASLTHNKEREKVINFSENVYAIPTQLLAKKGSGVLPTVESLKNLKVGVLQGSAQEAYARKMWGKKGIRIVSYQEQDQTFVDLVAGRVDVALLEKPNGIAGFLSKPEGKDYEFVGEPLVDPLLANEIGMGMRKKDKQLKADVDAAILELRKEGVIAKLAEKYFQPGELDFLDKK
ncbi:transporter substrate-binding domain-containing protein [Pelistega europaea]|uniref:Transporter substrate-binding domain-containing protein n=1 Tax=Pelistega europaea TaxID=106147 RepID=A0A7Y4L810_9BURK|nr:transporter substrate-binding domain-containing protein [Pelistega europaea]NOL48648.1 transporter substrate-binding domain-containing protein [Pelistega europaea]